LDDDVLAEVLGRELGDLAQVQVGRPARGPGTDQRDRPGRKALRERRGRERCGADQQQPEKLFHSTLLLRRIIAVPPAKIGLSLPMLDVTRSDLCAGVAGAGTMGRGIAQVLAQCGARTLLFDAQPGAAKKGKEAI